MFVFAESRRLPLATAAERDDESELMTRGIVGKTSRMAILPFTFPAGPENPRTHAGKAAAIFSAQFLARAPKPSSSPA